MTTDIYNQHQAAFKSVSAYVIMKDNARVATIAFRFPKDGAGRLWAYVHWIGTEMVRGYANGYGYDKKSAAVESAIDALLKRGETYGEEYEAFRKALHNIGGNSWDNALIEAGFEVLGAV